MRRPLPAALLSSFLAATGLLAGASLVGELLPGAAGLMGPRPLLAASPAPGAALAGEGTARDLTGTWSDPAGTKLDLLHRGSGDHAASGTWKGVPVSGSARVGATLPSGEAWVDLTLSPTQGTPVVTRLLAARDRTSFGGGGLTLGREVPRGSVRLRVLQYNMEGRTLSSPGDYEAVARFVRSVGADVVSLDESKSLDLLGHQLGNQGQLIAALAGYDEAWGSDRRQGPLDEGENVLVRRGGPLGLKLGKRRSYALSRAPGVTHAQDGSSRQVLVTEVHVRGGGTIHVLATHVSHGSRSVQDPEIASRLRAPGILMGDFNQTPDLPEVKTLAASFLDAFPTANPGEPGFTVPAVKPRERIDYVFVARDPKKARGGGRVLACWCPAKRAPLLTGQSDDHMPVVAEVELTLR